jgi:SRSO17 transposase
VFLLYATSTGAAFLDRALYLPDDWMQDRVRRREAGIAEDVKFATKGVLAQQMLQRAFAAGVTASWVVGDTVYGYDELRLWLEEQHRAYVVAVTGTHTVWAAGQQQSVALLAALLPPEDWGVLSAGEGSQGPRLYEWAWLQVPPASQEHTGLTRWVLIRRSRTDPSKRAYYRVAGPATTTLAALAQVAGSRWRIEEGFAAAKGEVGLDHYEVRGFRAWYRYVTLALLAHAVLVVLRAQSTSPEKKGAQIQQIPVVCAGAARNFAG